MPSTKMLVAREQAAQLLTKRENWAQQESGVIVVFIIVGLVAIGLLGLFIHKRLTARRNLKQAQAGIS